MNLNFNKFLPVITGTTSNCRHYEWQSQENALNTIKAKQSRNAIITYKYTNFISQMINYSQKLAVGSYFNK
jgi:hypothetical protein